MAYLDTSTVRAIGKGLVALPAGHHTSVFTLIELADGLLRSEDQFVRRRAALSALLHSRVTITWQMPEAQFIRGFDWFTDRIVMQESRVDDLKAIVSVACTAPDAVTCETSLKGLNLSFGLEFFRRYRTELSSSFIESTVLGHADIRSGFESSVRKGQIAAGVDVSSPSD